MSLSMICVYALMVMQLQRICYTLRTHTHTHIYIDCVFIYIYIYTIVCDLDPSAAQIHGHLSGTEHQKPLGVKGLPPSIREGFKGDSHIAILGSTGQ